MTSVHKDKYLFYTKDHNSKMCHTLTVEEKRDTLRKQGRYFFYVCCVNIELKLRKKIVKFAIRKLQINVFST